MAQNTEASAPVSTSNKTEKNRGPSKVVLDWAMSFEAWKGARPESTCFKEVVAWEMACTNKSDGFRLKTGKFNAELPQGAQGKLGTTLTFPQWLRKTPVRDSQGNKVRSQYDLTGVWATLDAWREAQSKAPVVAETPVAETPVEKAPKKSGKKS